MNESDSSLDLGKDLNSGDQHFRAFVGPPIYYDLIGAAQFNLLTNLGLRENHKLLDVGCGSLRAARFFIMYLLPGNFYGIEPEEWLIKEGIEKELSEGLAELKSPSFDYNSDFNLGCFKTKFDYLIAQSIFTHCSRNYIVKCFKSAYEVLNDEGIFAFTYKKGDTDYNEDQDWVYPGVTPFRPSSIEAMAREAGLECYLLDNWNHPNNLSWALVYKKEASEKVGSVTNRFPNSLKKLSSFGRLLGRLSWKF